MTSPSSHHPLPTSTVVSSSANSLDSPSSSVVVVGEAVVAGDEVDQSLSSSHDENKGTTTSSSPTSCVFRPASAEKRRWVGRMRQLEEGTQADRSAKALEQDVEACW